MLLLPGDGVLVLATEMIELSRHQVILDEVPTFVLVKSHSITAPRGGIYFGVRA